MPITAASNYPWEHIVNLIHKRLLSTCAAFAVLVGVAPASAAVINFDDLSSGPAGVPQGYMGFTWGPLSDSWIAEGSAFPSFPGTLMHSGSIFAWSNAGEDVSLSGSLFDMNSMWARIGSPPTGSAIAHGFNGTTELFTQTLQLTNSYQLITMNFTGITSWTLTNQTNNVLMDDIVFTRAAIPEPPSIALLGLALAGLGLSRMRKA